MPKCSRCGKKGLFLKLYAYDMCYTCSETFYKEERHKKERAQAEAEERAQAERRQEEEKRLTAAHSLPKSRQNSLIDDLNIRIHPDLRGLLWFSNGPMKNYTNPNRGNAFVEFYTTGEPSAIDITLPIQQPTSGKPMVAMDYYPSYQKMTPEQRYYYLYYFLTNPYQKAEIGYVFVLYYGLERHLLYGDFERAFNVILKLRDVHSNQSFQSYSESALLYMTIYHQRPDLYEKFIHSMDHQYEEANDFGLTILAKALFHVDITADEMMDFASGFGFSNNRYIYSDHSTFKKCLEDVLMERYQKPAFPVEKIHVHDLPTRAVSLFANISLDKRSMDVPSISTDFALIETTSQILQEAHDRVKTIKAQQRKKTNTTPESNESAVKSAASDKKTKVAIQASSSLITYPACFFKTDEGSGYVVVFPDLNNLTTSGQTLNDALTMARECMAGYLYQLSMENKPMPKSSKHDEIHLEQVAELFNMSSTQGFVNLVVVDMDAYTKTHHAS